jgi:hypothetical protein
MPIFEKKTSGGDAYVPIWLKIGQTSNVFRKRNNELISSIESVHKANVLLTPYLNCYCH